MTTMMIWKTCEWSQERMRLDFPCKFTFIFRHAQQETNESFCTINWLYNTKPDIIQMQNSWWTIFSSEWKNEALSNTFWFRSTAALLPGTVRLNPTISHIKFVSIYNQLQFQSPWSCVMYKTSRICMFNPSNRHRNILILESDSQFLL